jgi:hypothetical protein
MRPFRGRKRDTVDRCIEAYLLGVISSKGALQSAFALYALYTIYAYTVCEEK